MRSMQKIEKIQKYNFFEKFMIFEILPSKDGNFRNATCNIIEKLCRQSIGVITPFS